MVQRSSTVLLWTILCSLAPTCSKSNSCTTQVSSNSICRDHRYWGYVPPGWCPRPWPASTGIFVAGWPHNKCSSASIHAPYFFEDLPTYANYALPRTTRDNIGQQTEATKALLENLYVDDYLDSVKCLERALNRSKILVHLLHLGGFNFTKFVSNVPNLADQIDGSTPFTEPKVIASSK